MYTQVIMQTFERITFLPRTSLLRAPTFLILGLVSLLICATLEAARINEALLASQHYNRILKYARCQTPSPRVINIHTELNPSAVKKYIPHCTVLHFCGASTGCCRQENEHCVPKTTEEVKLYFWTIELTPGGQKKGVEVIMMRNHTECMCAPIGSGVPRSGRAAEPRPEITSTTVLSTSTTTTTTTTPTTPTTAVPTTSPVVEIDATTKMFDNTTPFEDETLSDYLDDETRRHSLII